LHFINSNDDQIAPQTKRNFCILIALNGLFYSSEVIGR